MLVLFKPSYVSELHSASSSACSLLPLHNYTSLVPLHLQVSKRLRMTWHWRDRQGPDWYKKNPDLSELLIIRTKNDFPLPVQTLIFEPVFSNLLTI